MIFMKQKALPITIAMMAALLWAASTCAVTIQFFNPSQPASMGNSNITARTLSSSGYSFTYSVDGYWSAWQGGPPTGRFFSVFWPSGVQAQAITAGPTTGSGANITLTRPDGQPFELRSFTGKLLANTGATGGSFEIMPKVNGEDALQNPLMFDATGYAGNTFTHTPALTGYDTYVIHLWVDWALIGLTVADTNDVVPATLQGSLTSTNTIELSWPAAAVGYTVQQTPSLEPPDWTAVTNSARLVGTNVQVVVPRDSGSKFFRLFQ